jgi:hypothetical protein
VLGRTYNIHRLYVPRPWTDILRIRMTLPLFSFTTLLLAYRNFRISSSMFNLLFCDFGGDQYVRTYCFFDLSFAYVNNWVFRLSVCPFGLFLILVLC